MRSFLFVVAAFFALQRPCQAALVKYNLLITQAVVKTDGQSKTSWLINGQSPGPVITATKGDTLDIRVTNLGSENITIHWHGIEQLSTPWSDGVPGLTQYPITPKRSFTYNFKVTQTGAYWYHSHSHEQLADGLRGPIFLKPDAHTTSSLTALNLSRGDEAKALRAELDPLFLSIHDNVHKSAQYLHDQWQKTGIEQLCLDNILVNGKGQVICKDAATLAAVSPPIFGEPLTARGCVPPDSPLTQPYGGNVSALDPDLWFNCVPTSTPFEVFRVSASHKFASFNVVNSGSLLELKVSIDSHSFWVFTADGHYVQPMKVNVISVPVGERFQILVPLDQRPDDYAIRVAVNALPQYMSGYAVLSYNKGVKIFTSPPLAKNAFIDYGGNAIKGSGAVLLDPSSLHPFPAVSPPFGPADVTIRLTLERTNARTWTLNGVPLVPLPDEFKPLLFNPFGVAQLDPAVYTSFRNGSVVDIIMEMKVLGPGAHPPHPVHKHNVKAFFLGSGTGEFPAPTIWEAFQNRTEGLNLIDPPLRDSFNTPATPSGSTWAAIRFLSVNPAVTFIHCHLDPHLAGGMTYVLMEGIEALPKIPQQYLNFH